MSYFLALLPVLLLLFGASFLIHIAITMLTDATEEDLDIHMVEVVNFSDADFHRGK